MDLRRLTAWLRRPWPPVLVAAAVLLLAVAWLALNVVGGYGGSLTGLYYTGADVALPPDLEPPHTRRVNDSVGYDAQYYHLIAHDPLVRRGYLSFVDNPRLRWRRIGVPGLAAALTGGSDRAVDAAYVAIQLTFLFLGALWLSRYAELSGRHAAWGASLLAVPAVLVSLDRMTVDLSLAAMCVGFALFGSAAERTEGRSRAPLYALLAIAPLIRETGILLVAGWFAYGAWNRRWSQAARGAACALPAAGWWLYVHAHTPADGTPWLAAYPFGGILARTVQGVPDPGPNPWLQTATTLEGVALAGIWLALLMPLDFVRRRRWGLLELTAILFTVFASALGKFDIWETAYAAGRTMSPLLILLGLIGLRERRWWFFAPLVLILPRLLLQYHAQFKIAWHGLW